MKKEFKVTGMHCGSCEMLIKDSLEEAGAASVEASFKKGFVKVDFDDKKLTEAKIRELIKKEGYGVA